MIAVTGDYTTAVTATVRKWVPRVSITWTDPTIDPTITAMASDNNRHSYPLQCADLVTVPTHRWTHIDGICCVDSDYHPCPASTEIATNQMGWWSHTPCTGTSFTVPPTLTMTFNERPVYSLLVVGDSIYDEYPVDFDIDIYDSVDTLLYTTNEPANATVTWTKSIASENIYTAAKMVLTINTWNVADRVVKITEFYTGITESYTGDTIKSMDLLEESEVKNGSSPVGNISCNELDLSMQNIKIGSIVDPWSYGNTDSPYNNLLLKNRRIAAELGLYTDSTTVEYVPLGTFFSGDWDNKEQGTEVSTSARDRMELLRLAIYDKSLVYINVTIDDLLVTLLESAKANIPMSDLTYSIDANLADYSIPAAYFPRQSYFECLKNIMEACRGYCYMSRADVLICRSHE